MSLLNSNGALLAMIVLYVACGMAAVCEGNYWRAVYMVGAIVLTVALIFMEG